MPSLPALLRRLLLPAVLLAGSSGLRAGTAVRLEVPELLQRSELCLEGRVIGVRAVLEGRRRIDTEYTIQVARTLWGEPQAVRVIRIPGGVLPDGRGMTIPGLPRLALGEEAILFLSGADASGMRMPVGLAQGRLRVETDRSGSKRLIRDCEGLTVIEPAGSVPARAVLDYAGTLAEIEAAAARRRSKGVRR
ncbi:MAG: hypothetical protein ACKVXR_08970 [Planctomycetota bacterium]